MKLQGPIILPIALILTAGCSGNKTDNDAVDTTLPEEKEQPKPSDTLPQSSQNAEKVSDIKSSSCIGNWGYLGNPETDVSFSVSIKKGGKFEIVFSDYGSADGDWSLAPTTHHRVIMQSARYDDRFTIEDCEVGKPNFTIPAGEYSAERKFVLEKFGGDYWSEAKRRGIEILEEGNVDE